MKRSSRFLVSTVVSVSNYLMVSVIGSRIDRAAAEADFILATPLEGIVGSALMFPAILLPGGILASSDLAADLDSEAFELLLPLWTRLLSAAPASPEALERTRNAYTRDVAVLPPAQVASIIRSGGFESVVPFYQAGLIHAWAARRA